MHRAIKGQKESVEEVNAWQQDAFPELHKEDALWANAIRCSEELEEMRGTVKDNVLWVLLKDGIYDWTRREDHKNSQTTLAMRHSTVLASRLVAWIKEVETKVCPSSWNWVANS